MSDRNTLLSEFTKNKHFRDKLGLSEEQIDGLSFSKDTSDPLAEGLKKLIFSYCNNDAQITVIKNVNLAIEEAVKGS